MKLASVESILDGFDETEAWRPALIAFWNADGWYARRDSMKRGDAFDYLDRRTIEALQAAVAKAPR